RFIRFDAADCIVGFDCQDFLQGVRSTICFKCPYLHLTEALSTELCFTTKRLLCNESVWPCTSGVQFIIFHMCEFHHVHYAYGYTVLERFACASVIEDCLTVAGKSCLFHCAPYIFLIRPVKYR